MITTLPSFKKKSRLALTGPASGVIGATNRTITINFADFGFLVRKIAEVNGLATAETKATEAEKN